MATDKISTESNSKGTAVYNMLIDDFTDKNLTSRIGTHWRGVSDKVMGGISEANISYAVLDDRPCLRLTGDVRLENSGGFIQAALDLSIEGETLNASVFTGIRLLAQGNNETYALNLRTPDNVRVWQSYRSQFCVGSNWETVELPFSYFLPHRLEKPLDTAQLRRVGLIAIGRAFYADIAIGKLEFY
jgi:hypothetical protein